MSRQALTFLATVYVALGLAAGLGFGWWWQLSHGDCGFTELSPAASRALLLVMAQAGPETADEVRCSVADMDDDELARTLEQLAESAAGSIEGDAVVPALVNAAGLFGRDRTDLLVFAGMRPTATPGPVSSTTPEANAPASSIPQSLPYRTVRLQSSCGDTERPQAQIRVLTASGEGWRGQRVRLDCQGATDEAVTGLKPGHDAGYADFWLPRGMTCTLCVLDSAGGGCASAAVETSAEAAACSEGEPVVWFAEFISER